MALRITSAGSITIQPSKISEYALTWELDEEGQTAYELQYKLKKDQYWSTCGKVYDGSAVMCTFEKIYEYCPVEFYEIMYRLVIYLEGPNIDHISGNEGIIHSTMTSEAYWLMFMEDPELTMKLYPGGDAGNYEYPLFDSITPESKELAEVDSIHVNVGSDTLPDKKVLPLVQLDSPIAGEMRVSTPTGIKVAMSKVAQFRPTKQYQYGYVDQYVFDYETVYRYRYGPVYDYIPIYKYQTVYQHDPVYLYEPHYETLYDYKQYYALDIYYYEYSYYYPNYKTHSYTATWTEYFPVSYTDYGSYQRSYSYTAVSGYYYYYVPVKQNRGYHYNVNTYGSGVYYYTSGGKKKQGTYSYVTGSYTQNVTIYYYTYESRRGTNYANRTGYVTDTYAYTVSYTGSRQASSTYTYYSIESYTFVPSAYTSDYYTIYSYDYSGSMYVLYTYYNLDYYYSYYSGAYNIYIHHYYDYIDRYESYYAGTIPYSEVNYYYDTSYSYNYSING